MELLTISILTLLALYVIYSEPFKLPTIVKKNKNLFYILIIGLYLYYLQNNNVEGGPGGGEEAVATFMSWYMMMPFIMCACFCAQSCSQPGR